MRILCTGDLHIGRRPSRLPGDAGGRHACATLWHRIVDVALDERVDLVALSGDLVDQGNSYFEAVGPLEAGLRRLAQAGIPAVAVAGNHDHDVLPRLVDTLGAGHFHLLGRGGRWERLTLERPGGTVHVDGWSFPREHVDRSPLLDYAPAASDGIPVLGLLHADLGASASRYAPVTLGELRGAPVAFWLLGHVHLPALHDEGGAPVLYPGSPQPMDPGEAGCHGVWLLELSAGERPAVRRLPLATVRYEVVDMDVGALAADGDVERHVVTTMGAALDRVLGEGHRPEWLACRLRVGGRTASAAALEARLAPLADTALLTRDGVTAVVETVQLALRPALDLDELARGHDAPAMLARLIQALETGTLDAAQERLVRDACGRVADVGLLKAYRDLPPQPAEQRLAVTRDALRLQATRLLETLLASREGA